MSVRITHIRLSPPTSNDHEAITDLAWTSDSDGSSGTSSKAQMIVYIDGGNSAHVGTGVGRAEVGVVRPEGRNPYLRTYADRQWNNNLLSLPRF